MKTTLLLAAVAGLASVASADVVFTTSATGPTLANSVFGARATGDTVDTGNFIFNAAGGVALNSAIHTVGGSDAMTNALSRPSTVSSTVTTVGNLRTVTFSWDTDGAIAMIQTGDLLGGAPITTLSFETGSVNAGPNGLSDPDFIAFDHAPAATPGDFAASFNLLDATGGSIFAGTWFVSAGATGIIGRTFLSAGNADLATFNIGGGTATVRYFVVPAPSAMALLGLGGLVATRRRR
jgi:hypothetical protein